MKNKKAILVIILSLLMIGIVCYGIYYFFKNNGDTIDVVQTDMDYVESSAQYIDKLEQPTPNIEVNTDKLPDTNGTITELDFDGFKDLFKSSKRSILFLDKTGCDACESFKPLFKNALESYDIKAYSIDVTDFSDDEIRNMYDYIYFAGTPVTYIIENGKVTHTFNGATSEEVIKAFLDLYYLR